MIFKLLIVLVILGVAAFGRRFYLNQNKNAHLGGMISNPKIFWLCYTVYSWFFMPLFLLWPETDDRLRMTLIGWAILFWARGIAEMLMLYKWHNWRPPYGISHDIICLLFILYMQIFVHPEVNSGFTIWWIRVATFCMVVEIYYAYAFFTLCKGKTIGKDGVWFADPNDPIYRKINLITTIFNWPLYLHAIGLTAILLFD